MLYISNKKNVQYYGNRGDLNMRLLFIRHCEPDYETDSLTEKGEREAQLLAERMIHEKFNVCYCSTMGRAMQTAQPFLSKLGREAIYCDWLREFSHPITLNDGSIVHIPWDLKPDEWVLDERHFDKDLWCKTDIMKSGDIDRYAQEVNEQFDKVIAEHGYLRLSANRYKSVSPNHDTLVFVCHFGVTSVILGHMLGLSPMALLHGTGAPTSGVTQVYTEEIQEGIASFRIHFYGDISHLYVAGEPLSFNPRLSECFGEPCHFSR